MPQPTLSSKVGQDLLCVAGRAHNPQDDDGGEEIGRVEDDDDALDQGKLPDENNIESDSEKRDGGSKKSCLPSFG